MRLLQRLLQARKLLGTQNQKHKNRHRDYCSDTYEDRYEDNYQDKYKDRYKDRYRNDSFDRDRGRSRKRHHSYNSRKDNGFVSNIPRIEQLHKVLQQLSPDKVVAIQFILASSVNFDDMFDSVLWHNYQYMISPLIHD